MIDERGEIVVLNHQARRIFGFDLNEEVTKRGLNGKMKALKLDESLKKCLGESKKRLVTKEVIISQKNGKKQIVRFDVTPVRDANDRIKGKVIILRDITEEKEVDRMNTEFFSVVSHEIRTPLTSMKNAVDLILDGTAGAINENQRKFLSMVDRNINRLSEIISELVDISKIESGTITMELKPLDLGVALNMVKAPLTSKTKEKSISIHTEIPSNLPQVYGDSSKLEQIFNNLLNNAIKFIPEGGHIYISAKDYELDGDFIEVSVKDTGIGISPEKLEKIFDKFYQVENSMTRETKGTGLGLSIVKSLVELQGGKIWVESEEGKGSKFTFTLPKHSPERVLKD